MAKQETFKAARERLFSALTAAGWSVATWSTRTMKPLKVPYATRGADKIWFQPQALYYSNIVGTLNDARSISADIRGMTVSRIEELVAYYGKL